MELKVNCSKCKNINELSVDSSLAGFQHTTNCKFCNKQLRFNVPEDNLTDVIEKNAAIVTGGTIELLKSQYSDSQNYKLSKGKNSIGRKSSTNKSSIQIKTKDRYFSREHCQIELKQDKKGDLLFELSDLDSSNGTFLNDEKLINSSRVYLYENDIIKCGNSLLKLNINTQ